MFRLLPGNSKKLDFRRVGCTAADFRREAKSAKFPVRTGEGDLLGELEVSDLKEPWCPMHSLLPEAEPSLWRIEASLRLTEFMEEGVKEGWGEGGMGDNWGMTKYFWAFSDVASNLMRGDLGVLGEEPPRGLECNIFPGDSKPGEAADDVPVETEVEVELLLGLQLLSVPE